MSHYVLDPLELAKKQLARDRVRTARVRAWMSGGSLYEHKIDRMSPTPLAFLRGAAPMFYEILERVPVLADGPDGEGTIVGDLHMENFGAFRPDPTKKKHRRKTVTPSAVFDVNDFDDCTIGPWRFDLLRLTTSLILAGRELGANGREAIALARALLDSYANELDHPHDLPPSPRSVLTLLARAGTRNRRALLDARTEAYKKSRRFVRGPRYAQLSPALARDAERAFYEYVEHHAPKHRELYEIRDMAFRVAGTGSLGCLRVAVLVRGKGKRDGEWVFDMKEEDPRSSAAPLVSKNKLRGAERVEVGIRACLDLVPRGLGRTILRGLPMIVRRLTPQEDKLDLQSFPKNELNALARLLGALIGRAHVHGATKAPSRTWSVSDRRYLIDSAARLAGIHEAAYLAFCQVVST